MATPSEWWMDLDQWVLQDGNYADFVVGEWRQFALGCDVNPSRPRPLVQVPGHVPVQARPGRKRGRYEAVAEVVRPPRPVHEVDVEGPGVLDLGVRAYCSHWPSTPDVPPPAAGDRVRGVLRLEVDCFHYFEMHAKLADVPPLIYTWVVEEVQLFRQHFEPAESGDPRIPRREGPIGRRMVRDRSREGWESAGATRCWDDGDVGYRLRCSLLPVPPASEFDPALDATR